MAGVAAGVAEVAEVVVGRVSQGVGCQRYGTEHKAITLLN